MRLAVKAQSLGIPFKDLGTYLTFATNQAIRLGKPVQEFADLMIMAVGKQQARGLVQMGLATKEANAAFKDAGGILGFVSKKLDEMGTIADTTAIKMGKLTVAGTELKEAWGAWLNKSPVIDAFRSYFTDLLKAWSDESFTFGQKAAMLLPGYGGQLGEKAVWKRGQKQTEKERAAEGIPSYKGVQAYLNSEKTIVKQVETLNTLNQKLEDYKAELNDTDIADKAAIRTKLNLIDALEKQIKSVTELSDVIIRAKPIIPITGIQVPGIAKTALPGIQVAPGQPSESEKELANIGAVTEELENQQLAVDILSSAFDALFTSTEDGFKAMIDSIIKSIERLIAELLARVVVLSILNILTGGTATFGQILKSAAGNMGLIKVTGGAAGLTVPGGYSHDTFPAMLSSGETVLTAQQSRDFNKPVRVHVTGEISGRDIILAMRRTGYEI
jgi:hypothetical protein